MENPCYTLMGWGPLTSPYAYLDRQARPPSRTALRVRAEMAATAVSARAQYSGL